MIATYAEVRSALLDAAAVLPHPTKTDRADSLAADGTVRKRGGPHPYGSTRGTVVYREGGNVGLAVKTKGKLRYYVARGDNHEASCYALAHHLGLSAVRRKEDGAVLVPDVGVRVDEVEAGLFWAWIVTKG